MSREPRDPARPARASAPALPQVFTHDENFVWPKEPPLFYLLARTGLYRCRNHEFFRSCVETRSGPAHLAEQEPFLEVGFPTIPRVLFEQVVGFFDRIRELHNSEASVLLAFDREAREVRIVVPEQVATVVRHSDGYQSPIGLHYFPPLDLPRHWVMFGDIHSHVNMAAYSSGTDVDDEAHSAGLHVVVGRLYREPVDTHVEAVVDGERFLLDIEDVVEGYERRSSEVPQEWIERVSVEASTAGTWSAGAWGGGGWSGGGSGGADRSEETRDS